MIVFAVLALPLLVAAVGVIPRTERLLPALTFAFSVCTFGLTIVIALEVLARRDLVAVPHWVGIDALSALLLLVIAAVTSLAALFSMGYIQRLTSEPSWSPRLYYVNFNLFVFSMLAIPVVTEPGLAWIAVELTTLLSIFLVAFENTAEALEAAWKYMTITLFGATTAVLGFLVLFWAMHSAHATDFTWSGLHSIATAMPPPLLRVSFLLILVGFGAKAGLIPMHTWLPDAHSQAPSPVCALLSGIETTAVLYVILRLLPIFGAAPAVHAKEWGFVFGLVSVGGAAFLMIQTHDYKRLFAFSTVEHMGIILTAASFGGILAGYGTAWQIVTHAVTKSFCFYAAGSVLLLTGSRQIASIRGLVERSRGVAIALLLGALAIAGAPPFAVFFSELTILRAGFGQGQYVQAGLLALFIVIAFFGMLYHVNRMVFGEASNSAAEPMPAARSLPVPCATALAIGAVPVVALGLFVPPPLHALMQQAAGILAR